MLRSTHFKALALSLPLAFGSLSLTGCQDGALENAGEEVDEAAEEVKDEVDDAVSGD